MKRVYSLKIEKLSLLMKQFVLICSVLLWSATHTDAQHLFPQIELFSPQSDLSLNLFKDHYELSKLEFHHDVIISKWTKKGSYTFSNDTLLLNQDQGKTLQLKKITYEIYEPIDLDTLCPGHALSDLKFLAWTIRYSNGMIMQNGGWNRDNKKEGLWSYFDSTGRPIAPAQLPPSSAQPDASPGSRTLSSTHKRQ
jgi:hypothetical protein